MPQHWLRYVMQPWDKDLKKWHFVAVLLRSWLSDYPESWYYLLSQLLWWGKKDKFSAGTTAIPLRQAGAARWRAARQGAGQGQGWAVGAEAAITPSTAPQPHRTSGAGPGHWTSVRQSPARADPAAVARKPQARQRRHGSEQERGTARRAGEGRSQNAAVQPRGWARLPNPGGAGAGVTVWARHAHTSNPSQRISLSVENYTSKNNHSTADLSERARKALGG